METQPFNIEGVLVDWASPPDRMCIMVNVGMGNYQVCHMQSICAQQAGANNPNHWIHGFYKRLTEVLTMNWEYIVGKKVLEELEENKLI